MKNKKEKSAFSMGMLCMLILSVGVDLFGQQGWVCYFGLALMLTSTVIVYSYTKSEKDE
jgi:hypothetical protein